MDIQANAPLQAKTSPEPAIPPVPSALAFRWRLLLACGVGGLLAACFPPVGWAFLLPLCVAAFLFLLHGVTRRQAFYLGFVFGLTWFCADLYWFSRLFGMAVVSLCALLAVFPTIFAVTYVWLRERLPRFPGWLLAPVLWTGIEYYRSEPFALNFGWMGLGYGVVNVPVLAKCAAWFGCYGLTFGIVLLGALLAEGFTGGRDSREKLVWKPLALYCGWLLLFVVPASTPAPERPLHVRLVQANSEDEDSFYRLSRSNSDAPHKPDVIVWPEYSFVRDPTRDAKVWKGLQQVAREQSAYLLFGATDQFDLDSPAGFRNTAYLLDPTGREVGRHVKNHPVHFIRDGVAGTQSTAIATPPGKIGVAICFDMDYPDVARRLAADGAEVFLVPNDDPPEWGEMQRVQHRLMFQMRAAECGKWLARADVAGGTSVAAPNGQETARVATTSPARLDVTVGRIQGQTIFVRGGWRFGQLCLFVSVALCGWALLQTRFTNAVKKRASNKT